MPDTTSRHSGGPERRRPEPIGRDEWLAEIERLLSSAGDEGMTIRELMRSLGLPDTMHYRLGIREAVRVQIEAGKMIAGMAKRRAIDGKMRSVPVYRPASKAP